MTIKEMDGESKSSANTLEPEKRNSQMLADK